MLHVDRQQIAPVLGLPEDKVRLSLSPESAGHSAGARASPCRSTPVCWPSTPDGPVKIVYSREESFFGHVHRHPATLTYEHGAPRDVRLVYCEARIVLDGGAYASSSSAVVGNAASLGMGPYVVPNVEMNAVGSTATTRPAARFRPASPTRRRWTSSPAELGMDPVTLRQLNAVEQGSVMPTGQPIDAPAPVADLLRRVKDLPLTPLDTDHLDLPDVPGALSNTSHGEGIVRGVVYAVGIKNAGFSEGFDAAEPPDRPRSRPAATD
ncbi:molybdopterin cofactor-binding domain-containing protein [Streptomyces sp. NPDC051909]|uniref:molybdopterin cofactor-binding domain-containing protein n=1 Tax=Streptomyces sp. NPDC051909 TaxID=3154944 RepID=UPI00342318DE